MTSRKTYLPRHLNSPKFVRGTVIFILNSPKHKIDIMLNFTLNCFIFFVKNFVELRFTTTYCVIIPTFTFKTSKMCKYALKINKTT